MKIPEDAREQHPIKKLTAGAIAGMVSVTVTYPMDLVRYIPTSYNQIIFLCSMSVFAWIIKNCLCISHIEVSCYAICKLNMYGIWSKIYNHVKILPFNTDVMT